MPRRLSTAQTQAYQRDGLVFPIPVLDAAHAARFRAACESLEVALGGKPRTVEVRQMHLHFRWAYEMATQPAIVDAVEDLLGPNLFIWATELFTKHPQDASVSIHWHRDDRYLGLVGGQNTTAWIALSSSNPLNGCMRVLTRSAESAVAKQMNCESRPLQMPPPECDELLSNVTLAPGHMSLHSSDVLHGSVANQSREKRVGFVIRFITPEARPLHGRPSVLLARGTDDHHHFAIADPPLEIDEPGALAAMQVSATRHFEAMLENLKLAKT
jgi:ectoine hydroxylase-related dioxygenase (phytanoyl-CoA dioxygenase family)